MYKIKCVFQSSSFPLTQFCMQTEVKSVLLGEAKQAVKLDEEQGVT